MCHNKTVSFPYFLHTVFFPSLSRGSCLSIHTKHKKQRIDERAVEATVAMLSQRRSRRLKRLGNSFAALGLDAALVELGNLARHGP